MRLLAAVLIGLFVTVPAFAQDGTLPPALETKHAANTECSPRAELVTGDEIMSGPLDENRTLYLIPCFAGAYNFGYVVYVGDDRYADFHQLYFADYSETNGWTGTPLLFNPWYHPETGELGTFNKGRGLGDCGTAGLWRWNEYAFKLLRFDAKDECDSPENPGDFPNIYTAPVIPLTEGHVRIEIRSRSGTAHTSPGP